jgi:uncharacterized protein involved in exopolysaccharide biosynthesis/Mrp family chromosome partitioning ATPase
MQPQKPIQSHERQNQAAGLNLTDLYYIFFRHKWKIALFSAAGFLAAAVVYFAMPASYTSEASLYIRYILESRVPSAIAGDPQTKTLDTGGANMINSEIEIIKSLDLAIQVAEAIGPEKILGKGSAQTNKYEAANAIRRGLTVGVPARSDILRIAFQGSNREIVQPVLSKLIDAYLLKHVEIHRNVGTFDDVLTQKTDALRSQLAQTEQDLRRAKTNAGVMSIEDSKKAYTEELSKIRQELFNTQAELAQRQAALAEHRKLLPGKAETPSEKPAADFPSDKTEEYKSVCGRLDSYRRKEQELLAQYTEESPLVRGIRERIAAAEKTQKELEADYPKLIELRLASSKTGGAVNDFSDENASIWITALEAKIKVLGSQLETRTAEAKAVNELEPAITELQRKRDLEETKYRHFSTSLEQTRFDELLGAGKTSNISVAQTPCPPYREARELVKILSGLAIGGVVAGFALAFLIEFFLDPTVRRPTEVETRLHLPLFLTIPRLRRNGRPALPAPALPGADASGPGEAGAETGTNKKSEVVPWHAKGLATYYDALRDRLMTFFDAHNLTHKPKLIAVTGCGKGAGVTTIATGLAASLSETGDGNVLLVDMNTAQGAAHPFFKGKPGVSLADALGSDTRDNALVQENLYAVAERGNNGLLPSVLPRRFSSLVPKLKASDYDYIIFDMPPVSQISVTARLAGFMDTVLLVIESEKTDRDVAKRAVAMLAESKAEVCAVLNKNQRYVPDRLQQEL